MKRSIREALELRGSNDFADLAAYQAFLAEIVTRKNARRAAAVAIELKAMQPLPRHRTIDFSIATVGVTRFGTIMVRGVLYTVPSRLVGTRLKVHIYDDRLVCHLGTTAVLTVARRYRRAGDKAVRQIDWRHLVGALVRKPQAFRHSVFRDDLFPTAIFRRAWEALDERLEPGKACRIYVGLLHLAATHACEEALNRYLDSQLDAGQLPDLEAARTAVAPVPTALPRITILAPNLKAYDLLLTNAPRAEILP